MLRGPAPNPNTPSAEPSPSDMAEDADADEEGGDDFRSSAYGGQNFSPLT